MANNNNEYYEIYLKNEYDANKQMSYACAFGGFLLFIMWIGVLFGLFVTTQRMHLVLSIAMPIAIFVLFSPLFYIKTERIKKPRFKNFVLYSFMFVVAFINVLLPKHGIIGWALCIVLTNHYYNPKLCKRIYFITITSMLICIYLGMFLGEYDPGLLGNGVVVDGNIVEPDTPYDRYIMMKDLMSIGINRYLRVFMFYYLSRLAFISILFFISNSLNKRTYTLFMDEIKVNSKQERLNTELNVARNIQMSTLPEDFVATEDVEILADLKPAKEVGGDFYYYFNVDESHIAYLVGDVSGKGIPSAMFMMRAITSFRDCIKIDKTPSQILKEVNKLLHVGNDDSMFITCFFAILNTKNGNVIYSNAGHTPPIVGKNSCYSYLKCNPGFLLGCTDDLPVIDETVKLNKNDSMILYTDGITEAKNDGGELYGGKRLLDFYNSKEFSCPLEQHLDLMDSIEKFSNGTEQSDDITLLTLKYQGNKMYIKEKTLNSTKESVQKSIELVNEYCDVIKADDKLKNDFSIVIDELVSNIVKYSYDNAIGTLYLRLLYDYDTRDVVFTIIDKGKEFNPTVNVGKELNTDVNKNKVGGLGILIVKNIMDSVVYDRKNGKNILTLKKHI